MAGFAGDDPFDIGFGFGFDFDDDGDYGPFDDYGGYEDEGEGLIGGPVVDDGDGDGGEFCISGFAFRDGDAGGADVLMGEDHASQLSHEDPLLETLGRSFDSDEGFSQFIPHLVSALDASEEEGELIAGNYQGGGGLELERGAVIEEAADDDDGIGLMLSGFSLDPRPVVGGFQTLVDIDEAVTSDDDTGEGGGGLVLGGFDIVAPQVVRPGWMVMGAAVDTDDADLNLLEMIAAGVPRGGGGLAGGCAQRRGGITRLRRVQGWHRGGDECPKAPLQALLPRGVHQAVARHQEHLPCVPVRAPHWRCRV